MRSGTGSVAVIAKRCQKTTGRLGPRQVSPASARAAARAGMRASAASEVTVRTGVVEQAEAVIGRIARASGAPRRE
jgi:hypothetical protein